MVRMSSRPDAPLFTVGREALMTNRFKHLLVLAIETWAGNTVVNKTDPAPAFVENGILARRPNIEHVITSVVNVCKGKYKVLQECY